MRFPVLNSVLSNVPLPVSPHKIFIHSTNTYASTDIHLGMGTSGKNVFDANDLIMRMIQLKSAVHHSLQIIREFLQFITYFETVVYKNSSALTQFTAVFKLCADISFGS
jgi:hypothetical protein